MKWKLETTQALTADAPTSGWWEYRQNSSGGFFDPEGGHKTIIWANAAIEADRIAHDHGIYFDGCNSGRDCLCCGDRWSESWGDEPDYPDSTVADLAITLTTPPPVDPRWPSLRKSELESAARWGLGIRIIDKDGATHWLRAGGDA